ncbi:peptide-methionine (S)-S-oxide reductase [Marinobacter daqiaonensis]|uniref:Peptide methionine sulfoxide reductase MsrA n=1 Tax=Marinobacter daqiaonensis TaxID=650891 RepID=A0A1I6HY85_9GAMM|nr:peptide-methionine (S)-S-oxide reductase MsrA [Marinobacter daqiaonensis]SFR59369.1 peptide-methionine (S)-S-oxide reductase [Marinobacter daqiaonensis]
MSMSCSVSGLTVPRDRFPVPEKDLTPEGAGPQKAVLAGGCFWCVEAVFLTLEGVHQVVSGYAGGDRETANYDAVCSGQTGHAEAVEVQYDPATISYGELLRIFFSVAHDPTQLNRQGNDRGPQYRSAIFYSTPEERQVAESYIRQLEEADVFPEPIVTSLEPLEEFYPAEEYHQNFAGKHPRQPYIMAVAAPKLKKVREVFPDRLKQA